MNLCAKKNIFFIFSARVSNLLLFGLFLTAGIFTTSCSFDYGATGDSAKNKPDIVMENLEYVRVRKGEPLARFQAEYAERWEDRQTMELKNFSFEQFEDNGASINAEGRAGSALVQLGSGDISLKGGVRIRVDSEDVTIRTAGLEWKDKEKILSGGADDEVDIQRADGTSFAGRGFFADARNRRWSFSGEVKGTYVEKEDGEEAGDEENVIIGQTPAKHPGEPSVSGQPQIPEAKPSIPEPKPSAHEPSVPEAEQIPEAKPPAPKPEQFFEPKPSLPAVEQPALPEDK